MVICLEWDADLHMAQLMSLPLTVSCFSKIQIGFTFLVPAHPGSPGQGAVKRACVSQQWVCEQAEQLHAANSYRLTDSLTATYIFWPRPLSSRPSACWWKSNTVTDTQTPARCYHYLATTVQWYVLSIITCITISVACSMTPEQSQCTRTRC